MDKFCFNPFISDTHYMWLYIYVTFLNVCVFNTSFVYKMLLPCLVPRIIQSIHLLTHELNSHTNRVCNHNSCANVVISTISSFMYETPFASCVFAKKLIHHTHHQYPTEYGKDFTYYYTIAKNSYIAMLKCFTTPESEFISSIYLCKKKSIAISFLLRSIMMLLVIQQTNFYNLAVSMVIIRLSIMIFYFNAFFKQHTDVELNVVPYGMNWPPLPIDIFTGLLFGRLSIEEGYGHEIHHKFPTLKPRYYNAIPTYTQSGVKL